MLGFDALASTPIAALGGDDSFAGQQATVQQGSLGVVIEVALTGQSCTTAQGTVQSTISVALTGHAATGQYGAFSAFPAEVTLTGQGTTATDGVLYPSLAIALTGYGGTAEQGTLAVERGAALSGQQASGASNALGVVLEIPLTGQSATAAGGTLTPQIDAGAALTGHTATVEQGYLRTRLSGHALTAARGTLGVEVSVTLTGAAATVESTSLGYINASGSDAALQLLPAVALAHVGAPIPGVTVSTDDMTFTPSPSVVTTITNTAFHHVGHQSSWVFRDGKYIGTGEWTNGSDGDSEDTYAENFRSVDPFVPATAFTTYPVELYVAALSTSGTSADDFPRTGNQYYNSLVRNALGGQVGIDPDGNLAVLYTRTDQTDDINFGVGDDGFDVEVYYSYQAQWGESDLGYYGPEVVRYPVKLEAPTAPFSNSMGLVVAPPTTDFVDGNTSRNAFVFYPTYFNDNGSDNWVPTYVRVSLTERTPGKAGRLGTQEAPIQLTGFAGYDRCFALDNSMCVTYSGYGNVAYISYLSAALVTTREGGDNRLAIPEYFGLIVMDLASETVYSHTLTKLESATTPVTTRYGSLYFDSRDPPIRPTTEVVKLSSGRSITQFLLRKFIANMSWTKDTFLAPTLTLKDGPVATNYIAWGWESVEVRGDSAYHVLYNVNLDTGTSTGPIFRFKTITNDATSTDASWSISAELWNWDSIFGGTKDYYFDGYSASKPGYPTWLYHAPYGQDGFDIDTVAYDAADNRLSFWGGQPTYASVEARGTVGLPLLALQSNGVAVPLTGHTITARGASVSISGQAVTVALSGHQAYANYTNPSASNGSAVVPLFGHSMLAWYGQPIADNGITEVVLTGQSCTVLRGQMYDVGAILSGHTATTEQGALRLEITRVRLTGAATSAQAGVFNFTGASVALTGQGSTASAGTLAPTVAPTVTGLSSTATHGSLGVSIEVTLTGQSCTTQHGDVATPVVGVCTGHEATTQYGSLGVSITVALTGQSAMASYGSFGLATDAEVALTGHACATAGGVLSSATAVQCSGHAASISQGGMGVVLAPSLTGIGVTTSHATLAVTISRVLPGELMTMAYGTIPLVADNNINITGVFATGVMGETLGNAVLPRRNISFWAIVDENTLFATTNDDENEEFFRSPQ